MYVRRASHSGSWYTDSAATLQRQLQGWLEAAESEAQGRVRAIIAPHAGYSYSGPTAAWAYKPLDLEGVRRIFVLGPSHHVALRKPAISGSSVCETPVGNLTVDAGTRDALLATGLFDTTPQSVDEDEHSIEMHLPYIAQLIQGRDDISVVPIIIGHLNSRQLESYAQVFAPYLDNPENLFVVSSDFCHWGCRFRYQPHDQSKGEVHEFISWLDHRGMALIESQDPDAFARYLDETDNTICGRYPIMVLLTAMRAARTNFQTRFVKYVQSSPAKSKHDSSVSYASAIVEAV